MSNWIIPVLILLLIIYANHKKINTYKCFCNGAKGSFDLVLGIFPYILAIMICIGLFRISGLCNLFINILSPLFNFIGIPTEVCELVLLRPFSGSGSLSILEDIISNYGADSYITRCACCIMGSSETIFYVSAIYFADSKIKNIAPAITIALIGNIVGTIFCCLFCKII